MDDVGIWASVIAAITGIGSMGFVAIDRRDRARSAGLHVDSRVENGFGSVLVVKVGDRPIFDVRIEVIAGEIATYNRRNKVIEFPEMTRDSKPIKLRFSPDTLGRMALKISYRDGYGAGKVRARIYDLHTSRDRRATLRALSRLTTSAVVSSSHEQAEPARSQTLPD